MNARSAGPAPGGIGVPGPRLGAVQVKRRPDVLDCVQWKDEHRKPDEPDQEPLGSAYTRPPHSHDGHDQTGDHKRKADDHEADQPELHHSSRRYPVEEGTSPALILVLLASRRCNGSYRRERDAARTLGRAAYRPLG